MLSNLISKRRLDERPERAGDVGGRNDDEPGWASVGLHEDLDVAEVELDDVVGALVRSGVGVVGCSSRRS